MFRYQHHPIAPGTASSWQLSPPAPAVIGWIPFQSDAATSPRDALGMLLEVGNDPPPHRLSGPGDFAAFTRKKDFRAALALDEIRIGIDQAGAFTSVSFYSLIRCGYTPIPPKHQILYWGGQGFGKARLIASRDEIRIRCALWFKLGKLTSLAARAVSGFWPASASAEIEVVVTRSPLKVTVLFSGSAVPSQCHYMDWQASGNGYDMLKGRPEDFEAFLKLGYCKDAMSHYTHRVEFSEEQLSLTRVNSL